jgi:hypothetical protein
MSREAQRQQREDRRAERDAASAARAQATKRRQAATPDTALALAFAQIAEHFYQADTFDEVLSRIAQAAVSTVVGCQLASVTMREDGAFCTVASTHAAATEVDQAQYQASEGPCLDAVDDAIVYAPAFPDNRWPRLGACPTESGVQSAVSYRLLTAAPLTDASLGDRSTPTPPLPMPSTSKHARSGSSWLLTLPWPPAPSTNALPSSSWEANSTRRCRPETSSAKPRAS